MNDVTFMKTNMAKVNKIIAVILWTLFTGSAFLLFNGLITGEVVASLFIELGFATFFILKKKRNILTMAILFLGILTCTIPYIGGPYTGMIVVTVLCVVSLYLNKGVLFSFGGLYSFSYATIYFTNNHRFDNDFFSTIGFFILTEIVLLFVSKRSSDLIVLSIKSETEAKELLNSLNHMVSVIHENTSLLSTDIDNCDKDIGGLRNISSTIAVNVKEIAEGIASQSESITHISDMMNNADEKMSEINQLSQKLAGISENTSNIVYQNSDRITQMGKQMNIIDSAVTESLTTVEELNKSMDKVNNFLSAINQISSQTNILALNANIEASRAGGAGKGFSVIANEIKKLAEQSSDTVKQIDEIITDIKAKTQLVFNKANNGSAAVKEGDSITRQVLEGFENIILAFKSIDGYIANELKMTDIESAIFTQIREQAENISAISQTHSAATEEMLATIQEQNANIEVICESIANINNSSVKLEKLIEKK